MTNVSCVNHFSLSKVMFRRLDMLDAIFLPSNISIKDLGCLYVGMGYGMFALAHIALHMCHVSTIFVPVK